MEDTWGNDQGVLSVFVSKAKDLPNLTKLDKQNVLLRLRIAHMTRESDVLLRAGQTPVFNYLEKFEMSPAVKPIMNVEIYCERKKKAPLPIGRCEIDLMNGIRADPKEGYCTWYSLTRDQNEFAGTVFIELTYKRSLPSLSKEGYGRITQKMDESMANRPIPPLPSDSQSFRAPSESPVSSSPERYMHASDMKQATPSTYERIYTSNKEYFSSSEKSTHGFPNFVSSIGTNNTISSQETSTSTNTTNSDTKFHFANLRKLKEKINVFKNPSNSLNNAKNQTENPVDIEALQKAIGVTSINNGCESDEGFYHNADNTPQLVSGGTRISTSSSHWNEKHVDTYCTVPELPSGNPNKHYNDFTFSTSSKLPYLPTSKEYGFSKSSSPTRLCSDLPPLPASPYLRRGSRVSRSNSQSPGRGSGSPIRRPPPPSF